MRNIENLILPKYKFSLRKEKNLTYIFDFIRKKYVLLTEEEFVRQHFLRFLVEERKIPANLIAVEKSISLFNISKRCDAVIFNKNYEPLLILECKSAKINSLESAFEQSFRYNLSLKVKYLALTNGILHYFCFVNYETQNYEFLTYFPFFEEL